MTALALLSACANSRDVEGLTGGASACTVCHGGQNGDTTGAPPFDVAGLSSSAAVGKHREHLRTGVTCASCHAHVALQLSFPGHDNGVANFDFGPAAVDPTAVASPSYNATDHTCSNVFCHDRGGAVPVPKWNASPGSPGSVSGCGDCHPGPAAMHGGGFALTDCNGCHSSSIDPTGLTTGTHGNGSVDVVAHAASWGTASPNGTTPHGLAAVYRNTAAYPTGLAGCRTCHGSNLNNPAMASVPSCDSCHSGGAAWRTNCVFCHGDRTRLADGLDVAGVTSVAFAPPMDAGGLTSSATVGAHRTHLYGATGISAGVACSSCHATLPTDLSHVNGAVTPPTLRNPLGAVSGTFTAGTLTCASTYCHGGFAGGNATNRPAWTDQGTQAACTACHGFSPNTGQHPSVSGSPHSYLQTGAGTKCYPCHSGVATNATPSALDPAGLSSHVNGVKDVSGSGLRWDAVNGRCYGVSCHGDNSTQFKTW